MTENEKREKVIKGLECHAKGECVECPYREGWHTCNMRPEEGLIADALVLLKAQEPRVMTLEEVRKAEIAWIEQVGTVVPAMKVATSKKEIMLFAYTHDGGVFYVNIKPDYYGKVSRCWTSRPTDEQREKEPWNG